LLCIKKKELGRANFASKIKTPVYKYFTVKLAFQKKIRWKGRGAFKKFNIFLQWHLPDLSVIKKFLMRCPAAALLG
jgi:hypothetical protein